MENSWQGFEADWLNKSKQKTNKINVFDTRGKDYSTTWETPDWAKDE